MELLVIVATVALAACACESSSDHDTLSEMREEFAQTKAENAQMKAENAQMKAEMADIKAKLNATTAGKLEFFVDGRTVCPDGTAEVNATKGRVLLGKPGGGKTGAIPNRPPSTPVKLGAVRRIRTQ
jgi:septal ring factor EnvC (AmiA/AmiB activator)